MEEQNWISEWSELGYCESSSKFAYIDACKKRQHEIEKLQMQLDRAVKVIRFYSDYCGGKRARQFLAKLENKEGV